MRSFSPSINQKAALQMQLTAVWGGDPVVGDPLEALGQSAPAVQRVVVSFSQPAGLFVHKVVVPHDRFAFLGFYD